MLSKQENEFLTRIEGDAPMGQFLREFWFPFLPVSEIPGPDVRPLRVKLFGERLLIYRGLAGQVALISEMCPHRRASLYYGRHEEGGLRCVYHGWKFAADGKCVEIPNEPKGAAICKTIKHVAYKTREVNGVVWIYMGKQKVPPPLPEFGLTLIPAENKHLHVSVRECNWMQALEGDLDLSHGAYLHSTITSQFVSQNHIDRFTGDKPRLEVDDKPYGVTYGVRREYDAENYHWGIGHFLFPFMTSFPTIGDQLNFVMGHSWIPIDDEHVFVLFYIWNPSGKFDAFYSTEMFDNEWEQYRPATTEPMGKWHMKAGPDNDFGFDEEAQRTIRYSGLPTVDIQDHALQIGMGPICDRENEHLVPTDLPIVQVRRRLINAAKKFAEEGVLPEGSDNPAAYRVRSASGVLPRGQSWRDIASDWTADLDPKRPVQSRGHAPRDKLRSLPVN